MTSRKPDQPEIEPIEVSKLATAQEIIRETVEFADVVRQWMPTRLYVSAVCAAHVAVGLAFGYMEVPMIAWLVPIISLTACLIARGSTNKKGTRIV